MAEKARRDEENVILDEVIKMFIERVTALDAGLRTKVDDHRENGKFTNSDLNRRTDSMRDRDSGKLAANVAAEAGF